MCKKSGHTRRVRVFTAECGIGAFEEFGYDGILISPLLLTILTREEFRQAMLHEFAHLTCSQTRRELRWRRLEARCASLRGGLSAGVAAGFSKILSEYRRQIEPLREREADSRNTSREEAQCAVSAIAKAEFEAEFYDECSDAEADFQNKSLRTEFERMLKERGLRWLAELESEPAQDLHPSFSERKAIYGVVEFDAFLRETNPAWIRETERVFETKRKSR